MTGQGLLGFERKIAWEARKSTGRLRRREQGRLVAVWQCNNTCKRKKLLPEVHCCICERVHVLGRAISKELALDIASVPLYYRHTNGTTPLLAPPP